jgi:hypothetical protein
MFKGLINDAKSAAGSLISKYLFRASVAVPFIVAGGFIIAAITLMLVERYGAITAYWAIAGGLAAFGAIIVAVRKHEGEVAEKEAEKTDTSAVASDTASQAMLRAPPAHAARAHATVDWS